MNSYRQNHFRPGRIARRVLVLFALCLAANVHASERALSSHIAVLELQLDARERAVLGKIADPSRRLLALRSYLRAGTNLRQRWSWTDEQIHRYEQSTEYQKLLADLDAVRQAFESDNPGFTLYANTQVRSLDKQIERWNANPRVGKTAANLHDLAARQIDRSQPDERSLEQLKELLLGWRPAPVAPLAAPGLSMHGQMRAIDFQIMHGKRIVAATEVGAVQHDWAAPGWDRRLRRAIDKAGARFAGPLQSPNEPWHYEYVGESARAAAK